MRILAVMVALLAWPSPAHITGDPPRWQWPLAGRPVLIRRFQPPPERWLAGHRGVDVGALPGETVRSAGPGVVGYAAPLAGRGVVTVIHPGGLRTTYMPVRASVQPGQAVEAGAPIGVAEDLPGHCPTPCLHWGLLRGDAYLDPLLLLGLGQVRLLPSGPAVGPRQGGRPPALAQRSALTRVIHGERRQGIA